MKSYTRISDEKIVIHCGVTNPDVVVVIDPTLVGSVPVTEGLGENGILIVNTSKDPKEMRLLAKMEGGKVFTVDADRIAMETLGKPLPNTPMMGALVGATKIIEEKALHDKIHHKFFNKLGQKGVDANIKAIRRAIEEVKAE